MINYSNNEQKKEELKNLEKNEIVSEIIKSNEIIRLRKIQTSGIVVMPGGPWVAWPKEKK